MTDRPAVPGAGLFPAPGSDERQALARRVAARLWEGRDERAWSEAGEYWQETFERLAGDALDAVEAETQRAPAA